MKFYHGMHELRRTPPSDGEAYICDQCGFFDGEDDRGGHFRYSVALAGDPNECIRGVFHRRDDAERFAMSLEHAPVLALTHERVSVLINALTTYTWHIETIDDLTWQHIAELHDILAATRSL